MGKKNGGNSLESQLEDYSNHGLRTSEAWSAHVKRWPIYATVGGAALAMTTSAEASIVSGNFLTTMTVPRVGNNQTTQNFQMKTAHGALLGSFSARLSFVQSSTDHASAKLLNGGFLRSTHNGWLVLLNSHDIVGPAAAGQHFSGGGLIHAKSHVSSGNFNSGVIGFAGFHLGSGDYGWIELEWSASDAGSVGDGYADHLTLGQWGIETSGATIRAGDTGSTPTPEPGTAGLALLASGAAGILAWRRRRNQAAGQTTSE